MLKDDIQTVLGLADQELQSLYEASRRDGDAEIEKQANGAEKSMIRATPIIEASPKLLEALKQLMEEAYDAIALNNPMHIHEATLAKCRKVLSKATGGE